MYYQFAEQKYDFQTEDEYENYESVLDQDLDGEVIEPEISNETEGM